MSHSSVTVSLLLIVALGFFYCSSAQNAVIPANNEEKDICIAKAAEKSVGFQDAKKVRQQDCEVQCFYEDGSRSTEPSPENQMCCPYGVMSTGTCDDRGKCIVLKMSNA